MIAEGERHLPKRKQIILIGKNDKMRKKVHDFFDNDGFFEVVEEAETVGNLTRPCLPDLIIFLLNKEEPEEKVEEVEKIKRKYPQAKIMMVKPLATVRYYLEAIKWGADGYLPLILDRKLWDGYLLALLDKEQAFTDGVSERMLDVFNHFQCRLGIKTLTDREREIMRLVASGSSNKEIADKLQISEYTVKNHLKNIFQKLHLKSRVQLARYAFNLVSKH